MSTASPPANIASSVSPAWQRLRMRRMAGTALAWIVCVFLAVWVVTEHPFGTRHVVSSILGGLFGGFGNGWLVSRIGQAQTHWSVTRLVLVRALGHTALIVVAILLLGVPREMYLAAPGEGGAGHATMRVLFEPGFTHLVVMLLLASIAINVGLQLGRIIGSRDLLRLLAGTYTRPIEEERVFLFLDMTSSTAIAERLGPMEFANIKNAFFHDLAVAVVNHHGDIFKYVGDAAIVTWRARDAASGAWALCVFEFAQRLASRADVYVERFGVAPTFKAGCHGGMVLAAEIGDLKRQIDYSGDAVNVAARLQSECSARAVNFIASRALVEASVLPDAVHVTALGAATLRGRAAALEIVALAWA